MTRCIPRKRVLSDFDHSLAYVLICSVTQLTHRRFHGFGSEDGDVLCFTVPNNLKLDRSDIGHDLLTLTGMDVQHAIDEVKEMYYGVEGVAPDGAVIPIRCANLRFKSKLLRGVL